MIRNFSCSKQRLLKGIIALAMILTLNACYEDLRDLSLGDLRWNPDLAVPILNTTFSMGDVIMQVDSMGFIQEIDDAITIVYGMQFPSQSASQIFNLVSQSFDYSVPLPPDNILEYNATGSTTVTIGFNLPFETEQEAFDSLWLAGGQLGLSIDEDFPADGTISLRLPRVKDRGTSEVIQTGFDWVYDPAQQIQFLDDQFNLANRWVGLNAEQDGETLRNQFFVEFEITLTRNEDNPQNITPANEVRIRLDIEALQFEGLFGDLGQRVITSPQNSIDLSFFDQIAQVDGVLELADPRLNISFDNSFGLPIEMDFSNLVFEMRDDAGSEQVVFQDELILDAPNFTQLGESINSQISMNRDNSNFAQLIQQLPLSLDFALGGMLNPGGGENNNFVLNTSQIDLEVEAQVPFYGRFSDLIIDERINFNGENFDGVQSALLQIKTNNQLALEVNLSAFLLGEDDVELASLVSTTEPLLRPRGESTTIISLDEAALNSLGDTRRIRLVISLSTENWQSGNLIKISQNDQIQISMGLQANIDLTSN